MGSHSLPNLTGSWAGIPRNQRVCNLCGSQAQTKGMWYLSAPLQLSTTACSRDASACESSCGSLVLCRLPILWQLA